MAESEDSAVTLGELSRHIKSLSGEVHAVRDKLDNLTSWRDVQRVEEGLRAKHDADIAAVNLQVSALTARLQVLEDWQKWFQRIVIGAVVLAILGVVIATKSGAM
ncbi:hypothetical protein [Arthrobacter sp. RCC_34]|uniref:hypothetical protein n=1 Tax=Arthrobacter sp. RCC_34 TaxID=3239230 RepID=UPI00352412EF